MAFKKGVRNEQLQHLKKYWNKEMIIIYNSPFTRNAGSGCRGGSNLKSKPQNSEKTKSAETEKLQPVSHPPCYYRRKSSSKAKTTDASRAIPRA
jgi:hypothetical protein